jgi:hypothetical protein
MAWTNDDLDRAMIYIADDIVCDAPAGRIEGAGLPELHGVVRGHPQERVTHRLFRGRADGRRRLRHRDRAGGEYVTVVDGVITYSRFIFDRAPFDDAHAATR